MEVTKQILPSKLRIVFPRRTEEDFGPPKADIPKGWGHHIDVVHLDIKIPSEHLLEGKQYAAEYQLYHMQMGGRGVPTIAIMIDIHPHNEENIHFQKAIDAWQGVFDQHARECAIQLRTMGELRGRRNEDWRFHTNTTTRDHGTRANHGRQTLTTDKEKKSSGSWNPYHEDIIRSIWFYGYHGSLTEPPCSEFVHWRIVDKPMLISQEQLHQMKHILFNHVDGKCHKPSSHYEGSVARPIQHHAYRDIYRCNCRDFISDDERKWYGNKRCKIGEEHLFHDFQSDMMQNIFQHT